MKDRATIDLLSDLEQAIYALRYRMETGKDLPGYTTSASDIALIGEELRRRGY